MLHSKMTKMDYVIEAVLIVIGAIVRDYLPWIFPLHQCQ